ncbi:hypothetical protein RN001_005734 [Aquatica leii]|uniref:Uncharacterized protein n=1 Tax=Aquatica leii TaxID=1421715 RepID=A0AAN7P6Y8_9COLE|nr:hypothetical protein RN001_005734 [Aquatica leii]
MKDSQAEMGLQQIKTDTDLPDLQHEDITDEDSLTEGKYVIIQLLVKKCAKHFVVKILSKDEENFYEVKYFRKKLQNNLFFPDVPDISHVSKEEIVKRFDLHYGTHHYLWFQIYEHFGEQEKYSIEVLMKKRRNLHIKGEYEKDVPSGSACKKGRKSENFFNKWHSLITLEIIKIQRPV